MESYIVRELQKTHAELIKDIKTFYRMGIDKKLQITDPEAYDAQTERLTEKNEQLKVELLGLVESNIANIANTIILSLMDQNCEMRTTRVYPDFNELEWGHTNNHSDHATSNHPH